MAFDREINYRVNIDDSGFQAKLSNLRASLDTAVGGVGAMGGMGGMSAGQFGAMMAPRSYNPTMFTGGMADFGAQIRPITYTPPVMAMEPNFGMVGLQQPAGQAFAAGLAGPVGAQAYFMRDVGVGALGGAALGAAFGGPLGALGGMAAGAMIGAGGIDWRKDLVPSQITMQEFTALSTRAAADKASDMAMSAVTTGASIAAQLGVAPIGSAIGGALLGGVGGFAGAIIAPTMVASYADSVREMLADNVSNQSALAAGSFRFITSGKDVDRVTGRGFSRGARASVADFIQSSELNDPRYGMDEYKQILEGGMQYDLFSGTGDIEQFRTRFKGLVDNVKTITSVLHKSVQEANEVIRGFRDMGVTDATQINNYVYQAEGLGRIAGKTGGEMLAIFQAGAEIFRGTGVRMSLGGELNTLNSASIRHLMDQGLLSRETIAQAGGENALTQQMTAGALSFTQTPFGRGVMMSAYHNGRTPGQFGTADVMSNLAPIGSLSIGQLFSFQANQEKFIGKMDAGTLQNYKAAGYMSQVKTIMNAYGGDPNLKADDVLQTLMLNNGESRAIVDTTLATLKSDPTKLQADLERTSFSQMARTQSMEKARNEFNFGKQVFNELRERLVQPVQRSVMDIGVAVGSAVERYSDVLQGYSSIHNEYASDEMYQRGKSIVEGRASEELRAAGVDGEIRGNGPEAQKKRQQKADILAKERDKALIESGIVLDSSGNLVQRSMASAGVLFKFSGYTGQSGEVLAQRILDANKNSKDLTYGKMKLARFSSEEDVLKAQQEQGILYRILTKTAEGGDKRVLAVTEESYQEELKTEAKARDLSEKEKAAVDAFKLDDDMEFAISQGERSLRAQHGDAYKKKTSRDDFASAVFGATKSYTGLNKFQKGLARRLAKERGYTSAVAEMDEDGSDAGTRGANNLSKDVEAKVESAVGKFDTFLGGDNLFDPKVADLYQSLPKEMQAQVAHVFALGDSPENREAKRKGLVALREKAGAMGKAGTIDAIEDFVNTASPDRKEEMQKTVGSVLKDAAVGLFQTSAQVSNVVGADVKGAVNGPAAGLSQEALTNIRGIAKATEDHLRQLIELVKELRNLNGERVSNQVGGFLGN